MKKVLIPTKLDKVAANYLTEKGYTVVQDSDTDLMALCQANADAEALIVRSEKITPEVIDALPQLKTVVRAGAGIVADSVPANEYRETINKAKPVRIALEQAQGGIE